MEGPNCQGCVQRDQIIAALSAEVAALRAELRELKARLGLNSQNSSLPPSADPPGAPQRPKKQRSGRKRGGQPRHPGHSRQRLPAARVSQVITYVPEVCDHCQAPLPPEPQPQDPPATWHQVVELPPVLAEVVEHQGQARTCSCCGQVTRAPIPKAVLAHGFGPRLTAVAALLTGRCHLSKRALAEVMDTVFGVPLSLGMVPRMEREMSAALAQPHGEALRAVRGAASRNVDETSWKRAGKLQWLWTAVTRKAVAFVIHARRGYSGLRALLGSRCHGYLTSDRWSVYNAWPLELRQVCWAHLQRDFQKLVDRGKPAAAIGQEALAITDLVFTAWHLFRDGQRSRRWLQREISVWRQALHEQLHAGTRCRDAKAARFCANLLALEPALWRFAWADRLEPTNNQAERVLRQGVLWRKRSFGCASAAGCRFVERILTVIESLRLGGRQILDYLHQAIDAHRNAQLAPSLVSGP